MFQYFPLNLLFLYWLPHPYERQGLEQMKHSPKGSGLPCKADDMRPPWKHFAVPMSEMEGFGKYRASSNTPF